MRFFVLRVLAFKLETEGISTLFGVRRELSRKHQSINTMSAVSDANSLKEDNKKLKEENQRLKTGNEQLKKRVDELEKEVAELSKKRKASDTGAGGVAKKAKTPAQRKKLFEKWHKSLQRGSAKSKVTNSWGGDIYSVEVKETTPWTPVEFESIFGGKGKKVQPLPDNKPTSQITILRFEDYAAVNELFSGANLAKSGYKVQQWRQRNFQKSYKQGDAESEILCMEVHYNKSKQTLVLKFSMATTDIN